MLLDVVKDFCWVKWSTLADFVVDVLDERLNDLSFDALVINVSEVSINYLKHDMKRELR